MAQKKIWVTTTLLLVVTYVYLYVQLIKPEGETYSGHNLVIVEGWGWNTTRDATQYISNNLTAHILPEHFCDYEAFLVVMVCSKPSNLEARNAIRETWGQERNILGNNVSLYFLIGETANNSIQNDVLSESEKYGDIIQERFLDTYNNLTLKSIVMLKLFNNHCANNSKYLFKVDDDVFVNMPVVVDALLDRNTSENVLWGRLICSSKPIKDARNKWYVPQYMYSGRVFPNYLSGTAYIMSSDVAPKLYKVALQTPILHLEDVFITGICSKKAGIKPSNNPMFTFQQFQPEPCLLKKLQTVHYFTPKLIRKTYASIKDGTVANECKTQKKLFSVQHWLLHNVVKAEKKNHKHKCE